MLDRSLSRLCAAVLMTAPMFLQYVFMLDFVLLPEYFMGMLLAVALIKRPYVNVSVFRWIIAYLILAFVLMCFSVLFYEHVNFVLAGTTYIRFFFYVSVLVFLSYRYFDVDLAAKILIFVAAVNAVYGLMQYLAHTYLGMVLPWHLPFLQVHYGTELIAEQDYYFSTFGYRFSGLFSEPAHLSQYLSFALYFLVFYKSGGFSLSLGTRLLLGAIIISALLLSASGTGFVAVAFVAAAWVIKSLSASGRGSLPSLLGIVIFLAISYLFAGFQADEFLQGLMRITSDSEFSTLYIRVIRPFEVFLSLDLVQQLFGIGYGNYAEFLFFGGALNDYEQIRNVAWTNSAVFILTSVGVVGFIVYLMFHLSVYMRSDFFNKGIVLFILMHLVYSDLPISIFYVTMMSFVLASLFGGAVRSSVSNR